MGRLAVRRSLWQPVEFTIGSPPDPDTGDSASVRLETPWIDRLGLNGVFGGRRGRHLREYLTAYALIAPALILIFTFGIFPVGFALYVSLHKWLIVRGDFRGLANYVSAIGSFAYIGVFALGLGGLIGAYISLRKVYRESREEHTKPWPLAIPSALFAAATLAFFRWMYLELPAFLDIATKMRGLQRTRELFLRLLSEAFHAEMAYPAWVQFVEIAGLALVVDLAMLLLRRRPTDAANQAYLTLFFLAASLGVGLLYAAYNAIQQAYAAAVETGKDPGIWPQLIMITSGLLLLVLAWRAWRGAESQPTNGRFVIRILAAIVLMVGAVLLIIEIPTIVASGDPDLWNGLKVTVFFSLGTVPIQLTIALFLSVILFRQKWGGGVFRVIFFLPYVTPALASATVFRVMFSERQSAPINRILGFLGIGPQGWLRESNGIFSMLAQLLGISNYPNALLPAWLPKDLSVLLADWLPGPSQALTVVIMLSIWTYVGYNVVIYLAGLGNIPTELAEAAEIDGADRWGVFRYVTFPLLSPTTYFLSLIAIMGTFKAFNTIWLLRKSVGTGLGTLNTISVEIFDQFFIRTRYGYASAMAFVLFAIILCLTYINNRTQGSRVFYG
jgi:multiple sugar transport system permease protein